MKIFLKPGEVASATEPARVSTILGSCIAVTIFNQRLRIGAICHALLPKNPKGHDALRYVDSAISSMLQKFEAMGIGKNEMEVKLLGGADVLERRRHYPIRRTEKYRDGAGDHEAGEPEPCSLRCGRQNGEEDTLLHPYGQGAFHTDKEDTP